MILTIWRTFTVYSETFVGQQIDIDTFETKEEAQELINRLKVRYPKDLFAYRVNDKTISKTNHPHVKEYE